MIRMRQRAQALVRRPQRANKVAMIVHALREQRHQTVEGRPAERIDGVVLGEDAVQ